LIFGSELSSAVLLNPPEGSAYSIAALNPVLLELCFSFSTDITCREEVNIGVLKLNSLTDEFCKQWDITESDDPEPQKQGREQHFNHSIVTLEASLKQV
jgi:hypothetical protein